MPMCICLNNEIVQGCVGTYSHRGPVTQYCGGSILCKNPIFFTMKEFLQI